jgi:ligand-binding sensor domain-containing protein
MLQRGLFVIVLFFSMSLSLVAQQYNYRHYTTREGLPSMVAYEIVQDHQGFIWIATKDGLCKFDGYDFKVFTTEDGLPDNEIIGVSVSPDNKVWALPFRSRLAYIENDTVKLPNHIGEKEQPVKRFEIDWRGHLWITRTDSKITEYYDTILNTYNPHEFSTTGGVSYVGNADKKGNVWLAYDSFVIKIDSISTTKKWVVKNKQYSFNSAKVMAIAPSQSIYVYNSLVLLQFIGDTSHIIFNAAIAGYSPDLKIMNLSFSPSGSLLIATSQGAFKVTSAPDGSQLIEQYLAGQSIGKALEDTEGNLWFCTLTDGIYMLSAASRRVTNIGPENGLFKTMPGSIFLYNGKLGVSSNYGDVYSIGYENGKLQPVKESFDLLTENLGPCVQLPNLDTYCASNTGLNFYPKYTDLTFNNWKIGTQPYGPPYEVTALPKEVNLLNFSTIKSIAVAPGVKGKIWAASANGLYEVDPYTSPLENYVRKVYNNRASEVAFDGDGLLWASLLGGIHYWQNDSLIKLPGFDIQAMATSMFCAPDGIMWVGSPKGLYGFSSIRDSVPMHFTTKSGLPSNIVNHIIHIPMGLIVATDKGICLVSKSVTGQYTLIPLEINDGLISKEVRQVLAWQDKLVALTSKGISIIDTSQIAPDKTFPKLYITLVNIAGRDTSVKKQYTLPYILNSLKLEYVGLSFKSDGDVMYRYKMEGIDTTWTQTQFTNVQYPALAPGKYRFLVDARSLQGSWSNNPVSIDFTILPPFWQTWWFRALMIVIVSALVIGVTYAIVQYYRNQSIIAQRMVELEGNALRANMNPHFVFNALNAIHDFIANSDERSAHLYLGKFAQLIRRILDQSRRNYISLEEELITLKLYLELENMRFEHKFDCQITIADSIMPYDIELPPMLIQPYLENAVRHGLMNLGQPGIIAVKFEQQGQQLKCTITDNGVGRKKAVEISSKRLKNHRSAGMEITLKRVELLNQQHANEKYVGVEIIDLTDEHGNATGTQVTILLPIKNLR